MRTEAQRKAEHDRWRDSSTKRGYGKRWQKARASYLARHPLCKHCERAGITCAAVELDHVIPHRGDMKLFWDNKNWQGLCKSCHSRKTATEDSSFARGND